MPDNWEETAAADLPEPKARTTTKKKVKEPSTEPAEKAQEPTPAPGPEASKGGRAGGAYRLDHDGNRIKVS